MQNTGSSSPCLAKCCLQQFGPCCPLSFWSHHPPAPLQDLNYFPSAFWHHRVSKTTPFFPTQGFTPPLARAEKPRDFWCPLRSAPASAHLRVPPQPALRSPWELPAGHDFKGKRYGSGAWEAASDVNHAICARDGALHLLC